MAGRKSKKKVDYFPHYVRHGRTLEILEQRYGIAGYYFWFKLLEFLGDTDGHYLDCNNQITWEYLASKTKNTTEICHEILTLLATLEAIDKELWNENKIIWCQKFVDGISDAYRNRISEIPVKPDFLRKKYTNQGISYAENTQIKEKKRKEYIYATPFFVCSFFEVDPDYRKKLSKDYPALTDKLLTRELSRMADWLEDNRQKKKLKSNGHIANPKLFIRNWLDRTEVRPEAPTLCTHGLKPEECKICRDYLPQASKNSQTAS